MPGSIQFVLPQPNQPFGWGYFFSFTLEPPDTTSPWDVEIILTDAEETGIMLGRCLRTMPGGVVSLRTNFDDIHFPGANQPTAHPTVTTGEPVTLRVNILQTGQTTITDRILVNYEPVQGRLAVIEQKEGQTAGGFTEADRTALMNIQTASFRDFGGGIISPISNLITVPPLSSLQRWLINDAATGEGILNPQTPLPSFVPHAIEVEIVSNAPGIGVDEGAPDALEVTYVELAANWLLQDGHFIITDRFDSRAGRVMWQPQPWAPNSIDYYITPGVVARLWWVGLRLFEEEATSSPNGAPRLTTVPHSQ